jgi:C4-dicarboxylate transporter DctM subunit
VLIPAMKRSGYPSDFSAAVQASGGSLGVVIPPSIPMIIFGFLTGASISRLFAAGILPGLLIGVSLITAMLPALGIDLIQLGVIVVANLAIGMLTPPMGICLIVSASVSGDRISAVSRRVVPFLIVLLVDLALICFYPPLTLWLSGLVGGN